MSLGPRHQRHQEPRFEGPLSLREDFAGITRGTEIINLQRKIQQSNKFGVVTRVKTRFERTMPPRLHDTASVSGCGG